MNWINAYNTLGDYGLKRSRKKYFFEFKLNVVKLYLTNEVSYQELALAQGINNFLLITRWVNDFRNGGSDALRPKKKGRKKSLNSNKNKTHVDQNITETSVDTSADILKN